MRRIPVPAPMREAPRLPADFAAQPPRARHALLINPFYPKDPRASFAKHVLTPTLALTSIAAVTPCSWTVQCWDENLLQGPAPVRPFPQVVGITVHLTFARRAYELAEWYRARGAVVVLGGLHVTSCPQECSAHADALAVGDGVALWPEILADVELGTLKPVYRAPFRSAYREDPPPRRSVLPRECFLTTTSLLATRGCHNRCGFCYLATEGLSMPYCRRDVTQIVDEFRADGQPYGVFVDNNLGSDREYLRRLCRGLRGIEKIWSAAVSLDVTDEPSLVREMALAGCTGVFVGFETLHNANLADAGKRGPATQDFSRRARIFHDHGIQVNGSFVLGFDHDRPDVFEHTVDWIEHNRLECATFHVLTPYPNTPLFQRLEAEGRLLHKDWSLYDTAHAVYAPRHMTAQQLEEGYAWCYGRLFSYASIWRRRPADWTAVPPYLGMSCLYKRCNWLWPLIIRRRLTHLFWRPLIELSRRRHLSFRSRLATRDSADRRPAYINPIPAGL